MRDHACVQIVTSDLFIHGIKIILKTTSSRNRIRGRVANTLVSVFYCIIPSSGAYTRGNAPIENTDRFNIEGAGFSGATKTTNFSTE
jgi:hypothetical protein